jgi:hypothetical protein
MGTVDGLSKAPYVRESRRILALKRVVEGDIAAEGRKGARAVTNEDSVGVGWYAMDLHDCVGAPTSVFAPTLPFQIPLGALIPLRGGNLLAACKNIGTTHLTNGAYRLHPVEWNAGESAGALAAFCCDYGCTPRRVWENTLLRQRLQYRLLKRGVPLAWTIDLPETESHFVPAQMLAVYGSLPQAGPRFESLELQADRGLSAAERSCLESGLDALGISLTLGEQTTWRSLCDAISPELDSRFG